MRVLSFLCQEVLLAKKKKKCALAIMLCSILGGTRCACTNTVQACKESLVPASFIPLLLVFYSQLVMMISTICCFLQVCLYRSWTTVRVMKAEQRAELLKRIKDQQGKKLSFQECREIAKDLNLSLEQVKQIA